MTNSDTSSTSRRAFLLGSAATSLFLAAPSDHAWAAPRMRYDLDSPEGRGNTLLYAKAVAAMQDPKINNPPQPQSWTFQAYIHGVPLYPFDPANSGGCYHGDAAMAKRIDDIYGNPAPGSPQEAWKAAATACWGTCKHGSAWFTTWHRWYMYYFEDICRAMCGDDQFTLPYWNYGSNTNSAEQLPVAFRILPPPGQHNPLFFDDRGLGYASAQAAGAQNVAMNQGGFMPFSQSEYVDALATTMMFPSDDSFALPPSPTYAAFGFTGRLECMPHDMVHNNVGGWMGNVPSAAGDPIFYVHHCQVDRLFASWQAKPGATYNWGTSDTDPSQKDWLGAQAQFVDRTGRLVTVTLGDCLDTARLGYVYDRLAPSGPAKGPVTMAMMAAAPSSGRMMMRFASARIGAGGTTVTVEPQAGMEGLLAVDPNAGPKTLVLSGVRLARRPPAPLSVYVNLPKGTTPDLHGPYWVGTIGLFRFDAATGVPMKHDDGAHGGHGAPAAAGAEMRFAVGEVMQRQRALGLWDGGPVTVTVTTQGADVASDTVYLTIDAIELVD